MFTKGRRSASLRARDDCRLWVLSHAAFRALLDTHATLARAVLGNLSDQLLRGGALTAKLLSHDMDTRFRVAFFDAKPYMQEVFEARNQGRFAIDYYDVRLTRETVSLAAGARAVCAFVNDTLNEEVVQELHACGVGLIAMRCAGYNNVDLKASEALGTAVVRVPAYSPHAVAEHTVALMLTLNRKVHRAHNRVRDGNFSLDGLVGFDIHGRTAGVVGAGTIGRCVVEILAGFGCRILVHDKFMDDDLVKRLGVQYVALDTLFKESDIISLHAPLLPSTRHMINRDAIDLMKPGVMIINTSRGALVDTSAMLAGLKSGKIGYAGLDVYEEESDYFFEDFSDRVMTDDLLARLTTFNNVLVTSHQAFLTRDALVNIADTTLSNIAEYADQKPIDQLTNRVVSQD
jgi:D-lactate dehydrogenase